MPTAHEKRRRQPSPGPGAAAQHKRARPAGTPKSVQPAELVGADEAPGPVEVGLVGSFRIITEDALVDEDAGLDYHDTTHEVDYQAIALGRSMPWFMEGVEELQANLQHYPTVSHGFSRVLANIHRAHPSLTYSWLEDDERTGSSAVKLYRIKHYESAGVWVDSDHAPCLVIHAAFDDGHVCMRLLYECNLRKTKKDVTTDSQWVVLSTGTGGHLSKDAEGGIKCDNVALGPDPSLS